MDRSNEMRIALNFIEEHLNEDLDCKKVAQSVYMSSYHFQRIFGIMCGITLGEYIRRRKLTQAAMDLIDGKKIIDVAFKYGYETPESFSRAFARFHGVLPSKIKSEFVRIYPRIYFDCGGNMEYSIIDKPVMTFVGFKKHFRGVPYGERRLEQENDFFCSTRGKQWLLIGASNRPTVDYCIITNVDENGYDFYIAYEVNEATCKELFDSAVMGIQVDNLDLEILKVPECKYACYRTHNACNPLNEFLDLRKSVAVNDSFIIKDHPEITAIHWRDGNNKGLQNRFIELFMPIQ